MLAAAAGVSRYLSPQPVITPYEALSEREHTKGMKYQVLPNNEFEYCYLHDA